MVYLSGIDTLVVLQADKNAEGTVDINLYNANTLEFIQVNRVVIYKDMIADI